MDLRQVLETYDEQYANSYDHRFLLNQKGELRLATKHELQIISKLLHDRANWLDVACGTGFFLSKFQTVKRAGIDVSPAMLRIASEANRDAIFLNIWDFRKDNPEWAHKWSLVTCMTYAYCLVDSISEIELVVRNFARWTAPDGVCFVPLCDPAILAPGLSIPYINRDGNYGETLMITGLIWTWIEESGKMHENLVAPQIQHMRALFEKYYNNVELLEYPLYKTAQPPYRKAIKAYNSKLIT